VSITHAAIQTQLTQSQKILTQKIIANEEKQTSLNHTLNTQKIINLLHKKN
jgi:hypothetical protein